MALADELRKLAPAERLRKLREIEKRDKKELEETEKLIRETREELDNPPRVFEAPPIEPIDISKLFEVPETLEGSVGSISSASDDEEAFRLPDYQASNLNYSEPDDNAGGYSSRKGVMQAKIEDRTRYISQSEGSTHTTASRSLLKEIKKYDKG